MDTLLVRIADIGEHEIADVLAAVLRRYGELFPEWEISTFSLCKNEDKMSKLIV